MRTNYHIVNNKLVACSEDEAKIIVCTSPDKDTVKSLIETYDIDEHTLNSALDPDEVSRFEFEPDHSVVKVAPMQGTMKSFQERVVMNSVQQKRNEMIRNRNEHVKGT